MSIKSEDFQEMLNDIKDERFLFDESNIEIFQLC